VVILTVYFWIYNGQICYKKKIKLHETHESVTSTKIMDTLTPSLSFNSSLISAPTSSIESQRIIDDNNDATTSSENYDIGNYIDHIPIIFY